MMVSISQAAISVLLILRYVHELETGRIIKAGRRRTSRSSRRQLGAGCWTGIEIAAVFAMARLGESFVLLRGRGRAVGKLGTAGVGDDESCLCGGRQADGRDRGSSSATADPGAVADVAGIAGLWVALGTSQGVIAALVADAVPEALRGTAFGVFNLVSGLSLLAGSAIGGAL